MNDEEQLRNAAQATNAHLWDFCECREEAERANRDYARQMEQWRARVQHWMSPSTLWQGRPVIGFMAETCLSDLETFGFKHFNPTWSFPTTSVYQNWDPMTFGMSPWHLVEDTEHAKDALVSQSPIVVFKSAVILHAAGGSWTTGGGACTTGCAACWSAVSVAASSTSANCWIHCCSSAIGCRESWASGSG